MAELLSHIMKGESWPAALHQQCIQELLTGWGGPSSKLVAPNGGWFSGARVSLKSFQ